MKKKIKNNAWNIRHLVDEQFVPLAQRTSVLYCRLTDFFMCYIGTLCIRETCCLFVKTWLYIGRMNVMLSSLFLIKKVNAIAGINAWQHPIKLPSLLYFFCFGESLVHCRYYIRVIKPQSQSRAYLITKGAGLRQGTQLQRGARRYSRMGTLYYCVNITTLGPPVAFKIWWEKPTG